MAWDVNGSGLIDAFQNHVALIFIYLWCKFSQQHIIWRWTFIIPDPFSLNSEKYPHPSPDNLQELHQENSSFQIIEMIKVR